MEDYEHFYHLTTTEALPEILKNGLKPMLGERSKLVGDTEEMICLCEYHDIAYWRIILGLDIVLQIDATKVDLTDKDRHDYSYYSELICKHEIPADAIKIYKQNIKVKKAPMMDLAESYMSNISHLCVLAARYYTYKDTDMCPNYLTHDYMENSFKSLLTTLKNIDFSVVTNKEKRQRLRELGDGNYSFVDRYEYDHSYNPNEKQKVRPRLYTMLMKYEKDDLYEYRHDIFKLITQNFKGCLDVNTGGWTG